MLIETWLILYFNKNDALGDCTSFKWKIKVYLKIYWVYATWTLVIASLFAKALHCHQTVQPHRRQLSKESILFAANQSLRGSCEYRPYGIAYRCAAHTYLQANNIGIHKILFWKSQTKIQSSQFVNTFASFTTFS